MAEDEGKIPFPAGVCQPVPVERRFTADHDVGAEGLDLFKELVSVSRFEVSMEKFLAVLIDNAGVHLISVQINSAVEWVLSLIQVHRFSLGLVKYLAKIWRTLG